MENRAKRRRTRSSSSEEPYLPSIVNGRKIKLIVLFECVICIIAFIASLLPILVTLDDVYTSEIAFAVLIGLSIIIIFMFMRKVPKACLLAFALIIPFIAAVLGATVDSFTNGEAYGYFVFASVISGFMLISSAMWMIFQWNKAYKVEIGML